MEQIFKPGWPSESRMQQGPVVLIDCFQEIPCNPCETACPHGAIQVGNPITNLPQLHQDRCRGCSLCIAACPGQAIILLDMTCDTLKAKVVFPFEYLPLPEVGQEVLAVNSLGEPVTRGTVVKVDLSKKNQATPLIHLMVPKEKALLVRTLKRGDIHAGTAGNHLQV